MATAQRALANLVSDGTVDACPFTQIREIGTDGTEAFVGELHLFRGFDYGWGNLTSEKAAAFARQVNVGRAGTVDEVWTGMSE